MINFFKNCSSPKTTKTNWASLPPHIVEKILYNAVDHNDLFACEKIERKRWKRAKSENETCEYEYINTWVCQMEEFGRVCKQWKQVILSSTILIPREKSVLIVDNFGPRTRAIFESGFFTVIKELQWCARYLALSNNQKPVS